MEHHLFHDELTKIFSVNSIDYTKPGFYDTPQFIQNEQENPAFLNNYGYWVYHKQYSKEYLNRVEKIVPSILEVMHRELVADGRKGACIDVSLVLLKILELHGIWSVVIKGSLNVKFTQYLGVDDRHFWQLDDPAKNSSAGHAWLCCPPYEVIDITIKQQPWDDNFEGYLPEVIMQKKVERFKASISDICSHDYMAYLEKYNTDCANFLNELGFWDFTTIVTPVSFLINDTSLRYIPFAFTVPDMNLEKMSNLILSGKRPIEIYRQDILPILKGK